MASFRYTSPLRYPGGKTRVAPIIACLVKMNGLEGCTIYELYAGGAGASLSLLFEDVCQKIVLNDLDHHIYAFWDSILNQTDEFVDLLERTSINMDVWNEQKSIFDTSKSRSNLEIGFATFFLNRTNRSGIINRAGPIGGTSQKGNWTIDARFNKEELINRILRVAKYRDRIEIRNEEAIKVIASTRSKDKSHAFFFLDPPYYEQGRRLYLNSYKDSDHVKLKETLEKDGDLYWLLTYDDCPRINSLYRSFRSSDLPMNYALQEKRTAREVMIFSDQMSLPTSFDVGRSSMKLKLRTTEADAE